jgi:membrane protein YqaA with SNARE-associated domain
MGRHLHNIAAFLWGLAEAMLFFIVPDVLLSYVGMKRGASPAAGAAVYAAVGAAVGGAFMYLWSVVDFASARDAGFAVPAIGADMGARAREAMAEQGWFAATLLGPLSSTPYKVYAILAPQAGAPLPLFMLASAVARLPRFLIVGCGAALVARWLEPRIGKSRLLIVFVAAWIGFYAAFFALVPS